MSDGLYSVLDEAMRDWEFDVMLDEYQEREAEMAEERAVMGDREAVRPGAERLEVCFGELQAGDYMTAETGPQARWVEVVEAKRDGDNNMKITFRTPQPLGVGLHDEWVIDRDPCLAVIIDAAVRGGVR